MNTSTLNRVRRHFQTLLALTVFLISVAAVRAANLVQEFYLPMPEAQIYQANNSIISGSGSTIDSTFSIIVTGNGTIIYYDQWEDGYETDLSNPTQSTTQIWGDGNDAHGIPPGFAHNPVGLPAGTVITLTNNVTQPRNPSVLLWDARDRIGANKALIISRAGWPTQTGPVFAGAVSVLSTIDYGTNYISPIGQNQTNVNLMKYVGMFIMAAQDNTAVTIDPNGNGIGTTNIVLNQGESYLVNGGIKVGGRVTSTKPIQAHLIIGHVGASYASDWFTLYPVASWSSSYYTPVGSASKVSQPAYVYLYNPGNTAITINYNTKVGSGSFSIPGTNGVYQFQMPVASGASFASAGGQSFYALCTVAANNSSDTSFNWGFTLVPRTALTTEADVGWAPGSASATVDGSPVWVTALANTKLYVDYKGDHLGPLTDPNGNQYDTNITVTALQSQKIFDPSKNQTGMRVYTLDGTLITAAWGEDADTAQPGDPYIDAGTTVLPFPVPFLKKTASILIDTPPAGLSVGDTIQYSVEVDNKGLLPLGNTVVLDAPSGNLTYVTNTTTLNGNPIPDNAVGNPFPLSGSGYSIPIILSQGTSTFQYQGLVNAAGIVSNNVSIQGTAISSQASLTPAPTNGATVSLTFSDTNGVLVSSYAVGGNVFVTMTNAAGNTSSNSVQTISVTVNDTNSGDLETIVLTETGANTGIFRNVTGLPTSATAGLSQQDGILNVAPGDTLTVSYTDPNFGDSGSATATISFPVPNKQLYLTVNGSTNGTQDLNRTNPVFYGHTPTRTSVDIGGGVSVPGVVGVDGSFATTVASASSMNISYTNGTGSNLLMLVSVSTPNVNVLGVSNNGVAMSLVTSVSANGNKTKTYLFSQTNAPNGVNNLVVGVASSTGIIVGINSFTNVNQSTPLGTASTSSSGSTTVANAANQLVYGTVSSDGALSVTGANQTNQWNLNQGANLSAAGSTSLGAANLTVSWSGGSHIGVIGVGINAASTITTGGGTNVTSFTQIPAFVSPFTIVSNGTVTITNFISVTNGSMPVNPAISATLQYNGTNIITLSNPTYSSGSGTLVWSGSLASNVTIPSGLSITYVLSNNQANVGYHINYDSTNAPSVVVLPASSSTVIGISAFGIYDAAYPNGNLVSTPVAGSTVYVRANVTDPFGTNDITSLGLVVTGPSPATSFTNVLGASNVVTNDSVSKTYEYPWTTGPTTGGFNVAVTANEGTEGVTAVAAASITTTFLDLGTPSTTTFVTGSNVPTNSYPAGSSVCVSVDAPDSVTNAAIIQTIIANITSSTGDSENVTLTETAANTGVYVGCINTSTNVVGTTNDGTLYAPVGSLLTATYDDPNDPSFDSSATATIQPAPGVPGVTMNKTILSPSGGDVGIGQPVTYNLQVINSGSTTLPNLSISDTFSSATLSYTSASLTPTTVGSGLLTWTNLGAMTPGQITNITVTFNTLAAGSATNSATANGVSATNSSSVVLSINRAALNVVKTLLSPGTQPVGVGSNVVFRITVQNVGNTVVNYLPLEDTFSGAYYQFVSATIAANGSGAGSLLWTNLASPAPLATNATITIDVTMKVVGQGNPANNTATVDFATDVLGNPVPTSSSTVGVTTASAAINGNVYNDTNQSGVFVPGDTGLSGVTLQLFTDPNGDGDPSDGSLVQIATTDANGYYELLNLNTGHYVVVESLLPGYVGSAPPNNRLAVNVTNLTAYTNENFFQYIPVPSVYSTISGAVWNDANGNGTNDAGEVGIANVEIDLVQDVNSNGFADAGEPVVASVSTDTNGNYSFAGVTPGHYVIHEVDPFGYYSIADSQGANDNQISFFSTNGIVSTNNNFYDRQSPTAVADTNATIYGLPVTINPLTNDVSPYADVLVITNVTSPDGIVVINPGSTNLTFTPTNSGPTSITYTIADAHGGTSSSSISVNVSLAPLTATANNVGRAYGQPNPAFTGTLVGVTNGDNITVTFASVATSNSPVGTYPIVPTLVDPNGRLTNYSVTLNNGTLTVSIAAPVVTWTNPVPIVYGTPLSTNQLNAIASVPGTLVYSPTNGTVLNVGSNTLSVVFTPTDTTDYSSATNTVFLAVQPAPLTVTASNASRPFGQPNPVFGGTLTGVVNSDNITASFASAATSNSPAGPYPIVPTLIDPSLRLTNYNVTTNNGTLTISSVGSLVTWTNPAPVIYGTPLGTNQLDATATVSGTFVYTPTNGAVLNVGTNTLSVVFTPTDLVDYNPSTNTVSLVVQPEPLTVTASNVSRVFGQPNPAFGGTLTGVVNGDNITATFASAATSNSTVGIYPIVPTLVDPGLRLTNYNATTNNGTLTIMPASVAVTWTNPLPIVYGTPLSTNQLNATAPIPGTFTYSPTNGTVLNVGSNTLSVVFTPTDTLDYNSATNTVFLVVQPAPLSVTANNASRNFGQTNPAFTGTLLGVVNGDNITATYASAATSNSPAGTYPIVPTLVDPNSRLTNYNFAVTNGTLTVLPASIVVTWTNPAPIIYGTPLSTNQLDATALVPGTFVYSPTNGTVLNVGSNTLSVVFTPTDTVDYNSATNTVFLNVQPAPLSITANNSSRNFGQTNPVFNGTVVGVVNGDNITATYASAATSNSPAGTYPIVPTPVDPNSRLTNYNLSLTNGTLTILSAGSLISWTNPAPIIYGTPLSGTQLDATATVGGTFTYSPNNGAVLNVGTNTLSAVFNPTDTVDYNSATDTVSLVVLPAPLNVAANNASRTFGQTNPVFTGTLTGVVNGDNITATYASPATSNSPAGSYPILPTLVDPNSRLTNYSFTVTSGTLTVAPASVTVTWTNPAPIIYGTPLSTNQLDASAPVPGTFTYSPTNGTVPNVGSNTLSVVFNPTDTVDYNPATNTVFLVILPAPLTVTASNASRAYGQPNPTFGGTLTGVVNSDNITATFASSATTNSTVGGYPIIPTLVDPNLRLTNYNVASTNGTLTIVPASVPITWTNPAPIVYGTPLSTNQLNATTPVPGTFTYSPTNSSVPNAGTNTLTVVFTPADPLDYNPATNTVTLVVTPAPLSVTANNASLGFGQPNPAFTGTLLGVVNGDNITATYASPATSNSPAGNYPIIPTLVDPNLRLSNYNVAVNNGTLTVSSVASQVTWNNPAPVVYGTALSGSQLNATANVPGTFVYTPIGGTVLDTGLHTLSVVFTPADLVDYNPATNTVSLTVLPAPLTITANNASRNFGQANPAFTGTITGVTNGDSITATYASSAGIGSPPGTYSIVPTPVDPSNRLTNYTLVLNNGTLTVQAVADVAIFVTAPGTVYPNSNLVYTITVTNLGPNDASNVVVSDNLPGTVTYVGNTGGGTNNGGVVTWPIIPDLTSGGTVTFTVTVNAPASGSFTDTASSTSPTFDPKLTNNNGSSGNSQVTTFVIPLPIADIAVLNVGPSTVLSNSDITYVITVTNLGPGTSGGIVLNDDLPTNVTFVGTSGGGVNTSGVVTWSLGSLTNGQTTNVTVTVTAPGSGSFTNVASATSTTTDPNPANNNGSSASSQVATLVVNSPFGLLAGTNTLNPQTGLYEEKVVVTNISGLTVLGVRLYVDGLRTNVTLYNASGTNAGRPYAQYNSSLNPNQTVTFTLEFFNPTRQPFTNSLDAEIITNPVTLVTNTVGGTAITRIFMDPRNNRFVIEFTSVPGKSYTIIYSDDLVTWKVATPTITASSNSTQWYDDGPPETDSAPVSLHSRFYLIIPNP